MSMTLHVICPHVSSLWFPTLSFNRSYWLCNGSLSQMCTESETLVALSATFLPLFQRPGLLFQFSHRKNQERARSGVNHTIHGLFGNWVFLELEITNSSKIIQNKDGEQAIWQVKSHEQDRLGLISDQHEPLPAVTWRPSGAGTGPPTVDILKITETNYKNTKRKG